MYNLATGVKLEERNALPWYFSLSVGCSCMEFSYPEHFGQGFHNRISSKGVHVLDYIKCLGNARLKTVPESC